MNREPGGLQSMGLQESDWTEWLTFKRKNEKERVSPANSHIFGSEG